MPQLIYLDMDDVLCDFTGAYQRAIEQNPAIGYPQSQYGFFANLAPIEGAIDAVTTLLESKAFEVYVLTAPSMRNPLSYTEKRVWIESNFGYEFVSRLILCPNKSLLKGDFLVDDNLHGKGQEGFEGEVIHFGSEQFPDWLSVRKRLGI